MSNDYKEYASKEWASLIPAKETAITDFLANRYNSAANVEDALRSIVSATSGTAQLGIMLEGIISVTNGYVGFERSKIGSEDRYVANIYYSLDGLTWTLMSAIDDIPFSILWDDDLGRLVALTNKGKKNYVSTDYGSTWTVIESDINYEGWDATAAYGNGIFIIASTYGYRYSSKDLKHWETKTAGENYYTAKVGIAYGNGMFCTAYRGSFSLTKDGIEWNIYKGPSSDNILFVRGDFVFYNEVNETEYNFCKLHTDGSVEKTTVTSDCILTGAVYAFDRYIASDASGNIYTSDDGINYTQVGVVGDKCCSIIAAQDRILFFSGGNNDGGTDLKLTVFYNKKNPITPEMIGAIPAVDGKTDQILRYGSDGKLVPSNLPIYYLEGTEDNPIDIDLLVTPGRYYINGKTTSSYELVAAPGDQEISEDSRNALESFRESLSSGNYFDVHVVNAAVFQVMNLYAGALSGMYSTIIRMIGSKEKCFAVLISKFFDDRLLEQAFSKCQPKLSGTEGQIVGFDENGSAIAQDLVIPQNGVKAWTKLGEYTFSDQSDATPIVIENLGGMSEFVFICSGLTNNGQTDSGMTVKVNDFSVAGQVIPVYSATDKYTYVDLDFNGLYWNHQRTGPCNGEANFAFGGISTPYMTTIGGSVADSITITPHNTYYATGGTLTVYGGK